MSSAVSLLWSKRAVGVACSALIAGCAIGPDYQRPELDVGVNFKNEATQAAQASDNPGWLLAQPADAQIGVVKWWAAFNDPLLSELMEKMLAHNASLEQSEARYRQALAALGSARAEFYPTLNSSGSYTRSGSGSSTPSGSGSSTPSASDSYSMSLTAGWEPDIWGKVRRSNEAAEASLQASQADIAATQLSLASTLAQSYFQAKNVWVSQQLLDQTIATYERVLQITQNRYEAGMSSRSDVASAQAQLENARTQRLSLNRQQGQLHNAMAVLLGVTPAAMQTLTLEGWPTLPSMPAAVPVQLLERRPDVASAERQMMAANAKIGVAQAAWLPDLTLSAQGGYRASEWSDWFTAPARFWSLGPALALQIFDGGARSARVDDARAAYDAQAASYRQTILDAIKEVEDGLVQWQGLSAEMQTQQRALDAARESLTLMRNQYAAGMVDFLSLAQVETSTLSTERSTISMQADHYIAAVQLIAALGGGWDATSLNQPPVLQQSPVQN
ncbi:efflux transporter outer membrane subunit [Paenalcaligenes sp. Me52]|uniref:efflux transporter outer membrane subunit n=1 Tax=Paenalcaligenes sp. Me52 TaxID=3392038 RepID=UPI003D2A3E97